MFLFVYPVSDTVITSAPVRFSCIQLSIIFSPGHMMTGGGGGRPSAHIASIIVTDCRFSGLEVYNSLTSVRTITTFLAGHSILTPDSSIL